MAMLPVAVTARLASASKLLILPPDVLWRVPFEAVPAGDGFLGDHATVVLAGSLDALVRAQPAGGSRDTPLAAVAAPAIDARQSDRLRQLAAGWTVRDAAAASAEINAVSAAYPAERVTSLTGASATEPAVRENLAGRAVVHIAAPARINAASPLFSPVLLSAAASGSDMPAAAQNAPPPTAATAAAPAASAPARNPADDGVLELREVMNLESRVRVVVLSDGGATSMRDGAAAADVL